MAEFDEQILFDSIVSSTTTIGEISDEIENEPFCDIKVKVDRKVLEVMLKGGDENTEPAEQFFIKVSSESGAIIQYPRNIKMDSNVKRNPQIRLIGSALQIKMARNKILASLDPNRNKVLFKLDISHTDHSHLIGKGGQQIQSIMNLTESHIHFPDRNRNNSREKSNQVTIAANSFNNVEHARQLIRHYLPLTVSFQVVANAIQLNLLDTSQSNIQCIQKKYNVVITFRYNNRFGSMENSMVTIFIKGNRTQFEELKEGTRVLYEYLNGSQIGFNNIVISIAIDICVQNHPFVMGRNNINVKTINDHTGAVVTFPQFNFGSTSDERLQIKNSLVTIKGRGIESAFMAWLELLGYLPLILLFDLKPDQEIDGKLIADLMANQEMSILIKPKSRTATKSILIKTQEKNSSLLSEARKRILNIDESEVNASSLPTIPICSSQRPQPLGFPHFPLYNDFENLKPEILRAIQEYLQ